MTAPEVLSREQEEKLLLGWVQDVLQVLRDAHGSEYAIGMTPDKDFAAWRLDGTGQPVVSADHGELAAWLQADHDARSGLPVVTAVLAGTRVDGPWDDPPQPGGVLLAGLRWAWDGFYLITEASSSDGLIISRSDGHGTFRAGDPLEARDLIIADFARRPVPVLLDTGALQRRLEFERAHPQVKWTVPSMYHKAHWTDDDGKPQVATGPTADALLRRLRERGFKW